MACASKARSAYSSCAVTKTIAGMVPDGESFTSEAVADWILSLKVKRAQIDRFILLVVFAVKSDSDKTTLQLVAAADKARQVLGWSPRYPELKPIVETAWNWHRAHSHGYADR